MTTESKIKLLTGAVYACVDVQDGYFYTFGKLDEKGARNLLGQGIRNGITSNDHFWVIKNGLRCIFVDKLLTALFDNLD